MIILGIFACILGIGALCWLLLNLAVFALPLFAGVATGLAAMRSGIGPIGAILIGLATGVLVLIAGQSIFTFSRAPIVRGVAAAAFAIPAAFAGYHATHGIAALTIGGSIVPVLVAIAGSAAIGATALMRMTLPAARAVRS
ncbi:hypothetical protein [Sphingomonas sp. DC1600-2]|uniref:hypothetical protein n=1 Tax=unclassified Sphingomonas TaxID=196159 RepID=UPI003CE8AD36